MKHHNRENQRRRQELNRKLGILDTKATYLAQREKEINLDMLRILILGVLWVWVSLCAILQEGEFCESWFRFNTSTKFWRCYISSSICLYVFIWVSEQNSSQTDALIWTRFSLNGTYCTGSDPIAIGDLWLQVTVYLVSCLWLCGCNSLRDVTICSFFHCSSASVKATSLQSLDVHIVIHLLYVGIKKIDNYMEKT